MSSVWNGESLRDEFSRKDGFRDSVAKARTLAWINDIQKDIASSHKWDFLRFKVKKQVVSGDQEISIAPQIPTKPTVATASGGSLADNTAYRVRVTFVLFDESGREIDSLESEPCDPTTAVTTATPNLSLSLTNIDLYDGVSTVKPVTIHRRIYLKTGTGPYYLAKTIEDNTTTTTTIDTPTSSVIEPPEYSLVACMSGDPVVEGSGIFLSENALDDILKYDPGLTSTGTPYYYARVTDDKIMLYPKPSSTYTLSYWVYRVPSRIFADTDRPIQLHPSLKEVLDAGVTWKSYEYKDQDGQESKKLNYQRMRDEAKGIFGRTGGKALTVKRVC
jgi:hypothetical protein